MRESKIESTLREGVEALGGTAEKFNSANKRGVPDRLICWPVGTFNIEFCCSRCSRYTDVSRTEFVETKAPNGRLFPWQVRDHARRRAMGFTVHVLWNLDGVEKYLRSRGKK